MSAKLRKFCDWIMSKIYEPLIEKIKRVILFSIVKICGFIDSVRAWHRTLVGYCYKLSRRSFNCCFTAQPFCIFEQTGCQ